MSFSKFICSLSSGFVPVISKEYKAHDYVPIDLSENNQELYKVDIASAEAFQKYIDDYLRKNNAKVAYGGYLESRALYRRSSYFNNIGAGEERNIHLGLDVWCSVGTAVLAPLPGKVHSFQNNTNFGDYGPTIILEHRLQSHFFYTLYGHLDVASLEDVSVGKKVNVGDRLANIGDSSVNGDYAPHLHFQIIKDLEGIKGDYPGVCAKSNLKFYSHNCPDPNLLLKI